MAGENENIIDVLARLEALLRAQFTARIGLDDPIVSKAILEGLLRHSENLPESEREFYRNVLQTGYWPEGVYESFGRLELDALFRRLNARTETLEGSMQFLRSVAERVSGFSTYDYTTLKDQVSSLSKQQNQLSEQLKSIRREFHLSLLPDGLGLDKRLYPLPRFIPVRVYLTNDEDDNVEAVAYALEAFSEASGFIYTDEFLAEGGSFFKKWIAKSEDAISQPEVQERLQKAERALELKILQKEQSEIDKNQADAAATLIKSLENTSDAVAQVGSLLIVKQTKGEKSKIALRTLSPLEMIHLEKNKDLLKRPNVILRELENVSKPQVEPESNESQSKPSEIRQRLKQRSNVKLLGESGE